MGIALVVGVALVAWVASRPPAPPSSPSSPSSPSPTAGAMPAVLSQAPSVARVPAQQERAVDGKAVLGSVTGLASSLFGLGKAIGGAIAAGGGAAGATGAAGGAAAVAGGVAAAVNVGPLVIVGVALLPVVADLLNKALVAPKVFGRRLYELARSPVAHEREAAYLEDMLRAAGLSVTFSTVPDSRLDDSVLVDGAFLNRPGERRVYAAATRARALQARAMALALAGWRLGLGQGLTLDVDAALGVLGEVPLLNGEPASGEEQRAAVAALPGEVRAYLRATALVATAQLYVMDPTVFVDRYEYAAGVIAALTGSPRVRLEPMASGEHRWRDVGSGLWQRDGALLIPVRADVDARAGGWSLGPVPDGVGWLSVDVAALRLREAGAIQFVA